MESPCSDLGRSRRRSGRAAAVTGALIAAVMGATATVLPMARQPGESPQRPAAAERGADRIRALQREADALASEESVLLVQLRRLEIERQLKIEELDQVTRDRSAAEQAIETGRARAEALHRRLEAERPEIASRLVRLYKLGPAGFWRLLLDVENLRAVGRAYRTASALTRIDRDRVSDHQRALDAVARQQEELRERLSRSAALESRARAARMAAEKAVAARTALVSEIDARRDLNAQLTGELHQAWQRLQASIAQLGSPAAPVVLPLRTFQGALPWPARGRILAAFGGRAGGPRAAATRTGLEIALLEGQTVRAVHEGTVAYAAPFSGYGNLVILDHGDRSHSLYGYLGSLAVSKGERVAAHTPVGASGVDTAGTPALYFELRVDGKAVDPVQWLVPE